MRTLLSIAILSCLMALNIQAQENNERPRQGTRSFSIGPTTGLSMADLDDNGSVDTIQFSGAALSLINARSFESFIAGFGIDHAPLEYNNEAAGRSGELYTFFANGQMQIFTPRTPVLMVTNEEGVPTFLFNIQVMLHGQANHDLVVTSYGDYRTTVLAVGPDLVMRILSGMGHRLGGNRTLMGALHLRPAVAGYGRAALDHGDPGHPVSASQVMLEGLLAVRFENGTSITNIANAQITITHLEDELAINRPVFNAAYIFRVTSAPIRESNVRVFGSLTASVNVSTPRSNPLIGTTRPSGYLGLQVGVQYGARQGRIERNRLIRSEERAQREERRRQSRQDAQDVQNNRE